MGAPAILLGPLPLLIGAKPAKDPKNRCGICRRRNGTAQHCSFPLGPLALRSHARRSCSSPSDSPASWRERFPAACSVSGRGPAGGDSRWGVPQRRPLGTPCCGPRPPACPSQPSRPGRPDGQPGVLVCFQPRSPEPHTLGGPQRITAGLPIPWPAVIRWEPYPSQPWQGPAAATQAPAGLAKRAASGKLPTWTLLLNSLQLVGSAALLEHNCQSLDQLG